MPKSISLLLTGALMLWAGTALAGTPADPDARIATIIAGRTAGPPTDCIRQNEISSSQIVDRTAILYRMNDGTIYVNRPTSGANFLRRDQVLVTDTHSDQLCSVDIVRLLDSGTHMSSGSVGLGPFVPYPRAAHGMAR